MAERIDSIPPTVHPRTGERLLWYAGAGHELRTGPNYFFDSSQRRDPPHVVLQLTLAGAGFHQRHGQPRTLLTPNRAFLSHIPGPFSYGWHSGVYELIHVSMQGEVAVRWMKRIHALHGQVLDFGADRSIQGTLRAIVEMAREGNLRDRYLVSGQLYGLLMQVLSVLSRSRVAATPLADGAIRLIHTHAGDAGFNVTALAKRLDCSREHLAREFRRATTVSPLDYLTQHRVRLAGQALRESSAKLTAVAHASGFSSPAYLCRVFRQTVGVTPAQFRARPWLVAP